MTPAKNLTPIMKTISEYIHSPKTEFFLKTTWVKQHYYLSHTKIVPIAFLQIILPRIFLVVAMIRALPAASCIIFPCSLYKNFPREVQRRSRRPNWWRKHQVDNVLLASRLLLRNDVSNSLNLLVKETSGWFCQVQMFQLTHLIGEENIRLIMSFWPLGFC